MCQQALRAICEATKTRTSWLQDYGWNQLVDGWLDTSVLFQGCSEEK